MKVGSLVEYIGVETTFTLPFLGLLVSPKNNKPYTVREFVTDKHGSTIVYVHEHCVGYNAVGEEVGVNIKEYRELLPPEEIAEVIEEANEVLKERELEPCH